MLCLDPATTSTYPKVLLIDSPNANKFKVLDESKVHRTKQSIFRRICSAVIQFFLKIRNFFCPKSPFKLSKGTATLLQNSIARSFPHSTIIKSGIVTYEPHVFEGLASESTANQIVFSQPLEALRSTIQDIVTVTVDTVFDKKIKPYAEIIKNVSKVVPGILKEIVDVLANLSQETTKTAIPVQAKDKNKGTAPAMMEEKLISWLRKKMSDQDKRIKLSAEIKTRLKNKTLPNEQCVESFLDWLFSSKQPSEFKTQHFETVKEIIAILTRMRTNHYENLLKEHLIEDLPQMIKGMLLINSEKIADKKFVILAQLILNLEWSRSFDSLVKIFDDHVKDYLTAETTNEKTGEKFLDLDRMNKNPIHHLHPKIQELLSLGGSQEQFSAKLENLIQMHTRTTAQAIIDIVFPKQPIHLSDGTIGVRDGIATLWNEFEFPDILKELLIYAEEFIIGSIPKKYREACKTIKEDFNFLIEMLVTEWFRKEIRESLMETIRNMSMNIIEPENFNRILGSHVLPSLPQFLFEAMSKMTIQSNLKMFAPEFEACLKVEGNDKEKQKGALIEKILARCPTSPQFEELFSIKKYIEKNFKQKIIDSTPENCQELVNEINRHLTCLFSYFQTIVLGSPKKMIESSEKENLQALIPEDREEITLRKKFENLEAKLQDQMTILKASLEKTEKNIFFKNAFFDTALNQCNFQILNEILIEAHILVFKRAAKSVMEEFLAVLSNSPAGDIATQIKNHLQLIKNEENQKIYGELFTSLVFNIGELDILNGIGTKLVKMDSSFFENDTIENLVGKTIAGALHTIRGSPLEMIVRINQKLQKPENYIPHFVEAFSLEKDILRKEHAAWNLNYGLRQTACLINDLIMQSIDSQEIPSNNALDGLVKSSLKSSAKYAISTLLGNDSSNLTLLFNNCFSKLFGNKIYNANLLFRIGTEVSNHLFPSKNVSGKCEHRY